MRVPLLRLRVPLRPVAVRAFGIGLTTLLAIAVFSQTYTGRILGTVTDPSGALVAGATVAVSDVQRGVTRTLTTDQDGAYVAPDLQPGLYKVRVVAKGFKTVERVNVPLEVAKDVRIDIALQPGEVSQTVEVMEEVPLVDTNSSTLGGTLSNKEINDLPLNGRNYENLLQLRPGVMRYPGGGFSTTSANGLRAEDNAYLIDGLFNSEPFSGQSIINGAGIAGDSATILPVDAIQEFNLQQNPPAEYGWKPGAIVNVGLKSGTNSLHGTAYGFYRDTIFDARNFFNSDTSPKTPRSLKQFGATLGGPIIRDKLFFFGGYEGQRYRVGNSGLEASPAMPSLPTPSAPDCTFIATGDCTNSITDAIADVQAAPAALGLSISPVSLQLAGCQLGPPVTCNGKGFPVNNGTNPAGAGLINVFLPNTVTADNAVGKIDYHISDRHTVSGMYFFGNNSGTVNDAGELQPQWLTKIHTRSQVTGTNWTWVPGTRWVNEARFGYNRLYQPTFTADHNVPASSYGINTGVTNPLYGGLPIITILPFNVPEVLGGFVWPKVQGPDTRVQFVDHISYTRGKHALKFGGELHRDAFTGGAYAGGRGRLKFLGGGAFATSTPLEDFFAGAPTVGQVLIGDPTRHIHNWSEAFFVQDDWRIGRNLTLNLGLRYEYNGVIKEDHNLIGNFDPTRGDVQVGQQISSPYQGDHKNFAPRAGFAWDPTGSGKTSIRGGAGIIYETVNWESFLAFNNTLGINSIPTATATGAAPGGGTIAVGNIKVFPSTGQYNTGPVFPPGSAPVNCAANPCNILAVDPKITTPYVTNWTLNVQHALANNLSIEVAYVGDHGTNLMGIRDINQPTVGAGWATNVGALACGPGPDPGCEQAARPFNATFPFLAAIYQMSNIYKSNYNALQATLTGRNYHGLSVVAGYTYAHALDDVGANWDFGQGLGLPQDSAHPQREYASSDFDIRHRFTLSFNYAIPGKKSFAQLLEGWQLNSIVTLASAQPWGPTDSSTDVSGTGASASAATGIERWDFFGNPSDFTSGPTGIPFFAGNSNSACAAHATTAAMQQSLALFGCFAKGNSVMIPPALGSFGTMGRNLFRDSGFKNWDFSVAKNWKIVERLSLQFRAEFFNILNHPNFANPFGGQNGFGTGGFNDPSTAGAGIFGCGCATPDRAAANPVIGSGGPRATQFGLKFIF
ncbi:MAG TPA: TonB-dependent receptor [Terriglobales bacterium]|nr:TonB-dependent receptor [Terriglobales bacterium]